MVSEIPDVWERIANVNNTWTCSLSRRLLDRGVAGLFHGTWKFWHDNGNLGVEQGWKSGKKHGVEVSRWSSGGKIREENYVDGQRHGVSRKWWHNGQLQFDSIYENGRLIKTDAYDSKGVLIDPSTGQPIE